MWVLLYCHNCFQRCQTNCTIVINQNTVKEIRIRASRDDALPLKPTIYNLTNLVEISSSFYSVVYIKRLLQSCFCKKIMVRGYPPSSSLHADITLMIFDRKFHIN
jgi:hypothetical protein